MNKLGNRYFGLLLVPDVRGYCYYTLSRTYQKG